MFNFTEACHIGIDLLDMDHEHLFELLNHAYSIAHNNYTSDKYDEIKALLNELIDYSNYHFAREEAYMKQIRDPELIMQRVQHEHFRLQLWEIYYKEIETDEHQKEVLEQILEFVTKWLYRHIIGSDTLIGKLEPTDEWMAKDDPCEFTDEYLTDIPFIDAEHKILFDTTGKLFDLLKNRVTTSDADTVIALFNELKRYTTDHFRDEEEYMESINYSGLEAQKNAHAIFLAELDDIDEEQIRQDPQGYVKSLVEFLLGWLINHIIKVDLLIPKN